MQLLSSKGDARPERILRRFFSMLSEVWMQIHELNQHFLPKQKQYRITGRTDPNLDPYKTIESAEEISGRFRFEFKANILNSSKDVLQQGLGVLMQTYVSDLFLQLGLIKPEGVYRLAKDFGKSFGQDVDRYLESPVDDPYKQILTADEVIASIMDDVVPDANPAEGWPVHTQNLLAFYQSDELGYLTPEQTQVLVQYIQMAAQRAQQVIQQQSIQQSAGGMGQPGQPAQPQQAEQGQPPVSSSNELLDERLPGAGGGANGGVQ